MAKKSRRAKAKQRARMARAAERGHLQQPAVVEESPSQQAGPMPAKQSPAKVSPRVPSSKTRDLTGRYQYVIPEMKRIGIIAGAIILVLIILSLVLPSILG